MRIRSVHGTSPVLGTVEAHLPEGLVAIVGEDERAVAAFVRLLRRGFLELPAGEESARIAFRGPRPRPGVTDRDLAVLRLGPGTGELAELLRASARALARARGGSRLDRALGRLEVPTGELPGDGSGPPAEGMDALRDRLRALEGSTRELRRLERELGELRARHVEVAGDVEEASMAWLRERQDAETHLQAYRDRARELKTRLTDLEEAGPDVPCPTCGRTLGPRRGPVLEELREEWESVVQDGSWWKKRREQLEPKPETLQELEGRQLRLQAAIEECSEAVERARVRVREARSVEATLRELGSGDAAGGKAEARAAGEPVVGALLEVRRQMEEEARTGILELAGRILARITGTRLLGLGHGPLGRVGLEGASGPVTEPSRSDRTAAALALRLATALAAARGGEGMPGTVVLSWEIEELEEEERRRAVGVLRDAAGHLPQILVVARSAGVDLWPELFDAVLELRPGPPSVESRAAPVLRALPAGMGALRLA